MLDFIVEHGGSIVTGLGGIVVYVLGRRFLSRLQSRTAGLAERISGPLLFLTERFVSRSVTRRFALSYYIDHQLAGPSKWLRVPGATGEQSVETDKIYVPLLLSGTGGSNQDLDHIALRSLLEKLERVCIIGDPGSGKSTLVKRLLRDECRALRGRPSRRSSLSARMLKGRFPLIHELNKVNPPTEVPPDKLGDWLFEQLREQVGQIKYGYNVGSCFDTYVNGDGLLLLLDGADEIRSDAYDRAETAIHQLSDKLHNYSPNNRIILTMRVQFHRQVGDAFASRFPLILELKPFSVTDIYDFLAKWDFVGKREERISQIFGELVDRPSIREMCSNPLILAMYVVADDIRRERYGERAVQPPDSRTEFYAAVVEELLIKRRQAQIGPVETPKKLREQRERVLGELAFRHLLDATQPGNWLDWPGAVATTAATLGLSSMELNLTFVNSPKIRASLSKSGRMKNSGSFI